MMNESDFEEALAEQTFAFRLWLPSYLSATADERISLDQFEALMDEIHRRTKRLLGIGRY